MTILDKIRNQLTGDMGISIVRLRCAKADFIFREKPTLDFGIDGEIETTDEFGVTGRLIGVQVKCGPSYLTPLRGSNYIYSPNNREIDYWKRYSLPVMLAIVDREREICSWQIVPPDIKEGDRIHVPKEQTISIGSADKIRSAAQPKIHRSRYKVEEKRLSASGQSSNMQTKIIINFSDSEWVPAEIRSVIYQYTSELRNTFVGKDAPEVRIDVVYRDFIRDKEVSILSARLTHHSEAERPPSITMDWLELDALQFQKFQKDEGATRVLASVLEEPVRCLEHYSNWCLELIGNKGPHHYSSVNDTSVATDSAIETILQVPNLPERLKERARNIKDQKSLLDRMYGRDALQVSIQSKDDLTNSLLDAIKIIHLLTYEFKLLTGEIV